MVGWVVQEARGDGVSLVAGYADDDEGFGGHCCGGGGGWRVGGGVGDALSDMQVGVKEVGWGESMHVSTADAAVTSYGSVGIVTRRSGG